MERALKYSITATKVLKKDFDCSTCIKPSNCKHFYKKKRVFSSHAISFFNYNQEYSHLINLNCNHFLIQTNNKPTPLDTRLSRFTQKYCSRLNSNNQNRLKDILSDIFIDFKSGLNSRNLSLLLFNVFCRDKVKFHTQDKSSTLADLQSNMSYQGTIL